jgi:DNA-binding winged helix-turn-helix (wHTH) protein
VKLHFASFTLDAQARQLTRAGAPVHLSPKAFDLFTLLVEQRPAVVDKEACRERLWPDVHVVDAALTNLVAEIRAALGEEGAALIRTVHGVGYAFAGDARPASSKPEVDTHSERRTPFWLVWKGRPLLLSPGTLVIGRDAACGVWVDEDGVSRKHARLHVPDEPSESGVTIEDLGSTNGTYVQGRRITGEASLKNGDRIRLGGATLIFRAQTTDAPTKRVKAGRK